jgi:hypothetical protein
VDFCPDIGEFGEVFKNFEQVRGHLPDNVVEQLLGVSEQVNAAANEAAAAEAALKAVMQVRWVSYETRCPIIVWLFLCVNSFVLNPSFHSLPSSFSTLHFTPCRLGHVGQAEGCRGRPRARGDRSGQAQGLHGRPLGETQQRER